MTSIYKEIRACQQNLVDEAANLLAKLKQD